MGAGGLASVAEWQPGSHRDSRDYVINRSLPCITLASGKYTPLPTAQMAPGRSKQFKAVVLFLDNCPWVHAVVQEAAALQQQQADLGQQQLAALQHAAACREESRAAEQGKQSAAQALQVRGGRACVS